MAEEKIVPEKIEKLLYDLGVRRDVKNAYKEDPDKLLNTYRLNEAEAALVKEFDVQKMVELGINSMAMMGYWLQVEPSRSLGKYLKKLNGA